MDLTGLDVIKSELDALDEENQRLEHAVKDFTHKANECQKLANICYKELHHQEYRLGQIEESLRKLKPTTEQEILSRQESEERIKARKGRVEEVKSCLPKLSGGYLKVILGDIGVNLIDQEERFRYKEKYEKFKLVVNALILIVALLDLMFKYRVIDTLLHFLLVWYHCTLTIRESILVANGSRIKGWWRALQFITGIKAGIIIVWPDGMIYDMFRTQFLWYIAYTSFLQFLQFHYQHSCLYRLRALGERYDMDITIQGFHSWMWKGLGFLLPFLYLGYLFQFYNAYTLYQLSKHPDCDEWQVPTSCIIFAILFLGNTITTSLVIQEKFKEKMINHIHSKCN